MSIAITLEDIGDYSTIPEGEEAKAQAWLEAINAILTRRYNTMAPEIAPAVFDIVGQAITERFNKLSGASPDPRIKTQSIAGASIEYFGGSGSGGVSTQRTGGYFDAEQQVALDELFGGGNVTSHRTPAPDAIRYGNLLRHDWTAEGLPIEAVI